MSGAGMLQRCWSMICRSKGLLLPPNPGSVSAAASAAEPLGAAPATEPRFGVGGSLCRRVGMQEQGAAPATGPNSGVVTAAS